MTDKYLKIGVIVVVAIALGITADFLVTQIAFSRSTNPFEPRTIPSTGFNFDSYTSSADDIELYYTAKTILSTINATLLISLLLTYVGMYKKLQSEFTVGLIIFSLILLLYALTSNPLLQTLFGFWGFGLGPFAMLPDLFTTLALVVLLYLTME